MIDKDEMKEYVAKVVSECEELYQSSEGYRKNENLRKVIVVGEEKGGSEQDQNQPNHISS